MITQKLTFALFMTQCGFRGKRCGFHEKHCSFHEKHAVFAKSIVVFERPLARNCNPMFFSLVSYAPQSSLTRLGSIQQTSCMPNKNVTTQPCCPRKSFLLLSIPTFPLIHVNMHCIRFNTNTLNGQESPCLSERRTILHT